MKAAYIFKNRFFSPSLNGDIAWMPNRTNCHCFIGPCAAMHESSSITHAHCEVNIGKSDGRSVLPFRGIRSNFSYRNVIFLCAKFGNTADNCPSISFERPAFLVTDATPTSQRASETRMSHVCLRQNGQK